MSNQCSVYLTLIIKFNFKKRVLFGPSITLLFIFACVRAPTICSFCTKNQKAEGKRSGCRAVESKAHVCTFPWCGDTAVPPPREGVPCEAGGECGCESPGGLSPPPPGMPATASFDSRFELSQLAATFPLFPQSGGLCWPLQRMCRREKQNPQGQAWAGRPRAGPPCFLVGGLHSLSHGGVTLGGWGASWPCPASPRPPPCPCRPCQPLGCGLPPLQALGFRSFQLDMRLKGSLGLLGVLSRTFLGISSYSNARGSRMSAHPMGLTDSRHGQCATTGR